MRKAVDRWVQSSDRWPQPEQELLLHAALATRAAAVAAWESFLDARSPESLDDDTRAPLPAVYRNLQAHGYPFQETLKAAWRQSQNRNQELLQAATTVVRTLHAEGIPCLLLGGVALSLAIFQDRGVRPTSSFDLLVPADEADPALARLALQGWRSPVGLAMRISPTQQRHRHAFQLVHPEGHVLKLQWHLLAQSRALGADAEFWQGAWPLYLGDERCLTLAPTVQLLHSCADRPMHPLWVLDAVATIGASRIDWALLMESARRHDVLPPVREALRYLREKFHAEIPRSVIWRLEREPVSRLALVDYRRQQRPSAAMNPLVKLAAQYRDYSRGVRDWPRWHRLAGFPAYLADLAEVATGTMAPDPAGQLAESRAVTRS